MSASQDKNQKFVFLSSNLYKIRVNPGLSPDGAITGAVIKAGDLHAKDAVKPYVPTEMIGKKIARTEEPRPMASAPVSTQNAAIESLKKNLQSLNELHSRLRFMLQELEELVKE